VNLRTYHAASIADALAKVKRDLGSDAVILHTRRYRKGGVLGIGGRHFVEITASSGVNVVHPLARKGKAPEGRVISTANDAVRRRYGAPPAPAARIRQEDEEAADRAELASTIATGPVASDRLAGTVGGTIMAPAAEPASGMASGASTSGLATEGMQDELVAIKRMVGQVLRSSRSGVAPAMPETLFNEYLRLLESEISTEIADDIVGRVRDDLTSEEIQDESAVRREILRRLEKYIVVEDAPDAPERTEDGPRTIALIGPTGVGKTTTIAKLAATYKLRYGRKVGLVTCDTYRIAAVDQLRTYANIIGLSLHVALTPSEVASACAALSDCDVVLIDTAGRSQHDSGRLDELRCILQAADPDETHLVLSGAASECVLLRTAERFAAADPNRVILTKLDEAVNFGGLVNAVWRIGKSLSFVTTGQEVPEHIEPGRADRLARLVLEGGGVR